MIRLLDSRIRSLLLSHGSIGTLANSQPRRAAQRRARGVREKRQMRNAACMPFECGVVVSPPLEQAAVNALI
jgi:hypothetical protein